jgi:hypothetical protein
MEKHPRLAPLSGKRARFLYSRGNAEAKTPRKKMNLPEKSPLPPRRDRDFDDDADSSNQAKINIRPRRTDESTEPLTKESPNHLLRKTGQSPQIETSIDSTRRRRRSRQNPSRNSNEANQSLNFKILFTLGAMAIFAGSNILVGRFFYNSGVSEGIQRAIDARTPASDTEADALATTNKAFAALLNLRGSKPDRPSTEMLTLLSLQALSETIDESLPSYLSQGHTTPEDFSAAYVAMRLGDFGKAAAILRATESTIPPDLFNYLMNDPVMRRFAKEPRVMGFYEKS